MYFSRLTMLLLLFSLFMVAPQANASWLKYRAMPERFVVTLVTADGAERTFPVFGWTHEVDSPRDAASGLPTGKRRHHPVSLTKPIDKDSAALLKFLISGDNIVSLKLTASRRSEEADGGEEVYLSLRLSNARVADISRQNGNSSSSPASQETIAFDYEEITLHFYDSGDIITDRWDL